MWQLPDFTSVGCHEYKLFLRFMCARFPNSVRLLLMCAWFPNSLSILLCARFPKSLLLKLMHEYNKVEKHSHLSVFVCTLPIKNDRKHPQADRPLPPPGRSIDDVRSDCNCPHPSGTQPDLKCDGLPPGRLKAL